MYFSGEESSNILINNPTNECMSIQPDLFSRVQDDLQHNVRVLLDTPLLRIRSVGEQDQSTETPLLRKDISFSLGAMPFTNYAINVTIATARATFKEMSIEKFKDSYLLPLDNAIRDKNIKLRLLLDKYPYPLGDPLNVKEHIQKYFDTKIADSLECIYRGIYGTSSFFGYTSLFKPPLHRKKLVQPDIVHLLKGSNYLTPELCLAIGYYKNGAYNLAKGFEDFKIAINNYKSKLMNNRQFVQSSDALLFDGEWSNGVVFGLVFRKCLYDALICGTDRVFISDHQTFTGFFQYEFIDANQMTIHYYIIDDPETIADGITLRSAIAGFFYKDELDAAQTKQKLTRYLEIAEKTDGPDPLKNVLHRASLLSTNNHNFKLLDIQDIYDGKEEKVIDGLTFCRVLHDPTGCFPSLGLLLPTEVFVKLYHYSSKIWKMHSLMCYGIPDKDYYYHMFFNELLINEKISNSRYACNFPKLFASGYWNGLNDHPMHIFEYLGEEVPFDQWDKYKVYQIIKSRIKELHSLGISHNDIRVPNIHVSFSGKVSLIDFGLSDIENNQERKKRDLENLDEIFEV